MIEGAKVLAILLGSVLTNNLVFSKFFAEHSALGENRFGASARLGAAVALIAAVSSVVNCALYFFVLVPLKLTYFHTVVFVPVITGVNGLTNYFLKAKNPLRTDDPTPLHALIAVLSVLVGASLLGAEAESFVYGALTGIFGSAGFLLAVVLLAGVRERLELCDVPRGLKGLPIALISAGLIALAFLGFSGFGG